MYFDRGTVVGQCSISDDCKYSATWRVDLGRVVSINNINIYYMKDRHSMYLIKNLKRLNLISPYATCVFYLRSFWYIVPINFFFNHILFFCIDCVVPQNCFYCLLNFFLYSFLGCVNK